MKWLRILFGLRFSVRNTEGDQFSIYKEPDGGVTISITSGWEATTIRTDPETAQALSEWFARRYKSRGPLAPVLSLSPKSLRPSNK